MEIIPGILEKDWVEIERKIEIAKSFAKTASNAAPAVHIDIIDGKFAPNTTFLDPKPFAKYSQDIFFEAHLMVEEPINYLKPFADGGFRRFLGHIEKMSDQIEFVAQAQLLGEVGLVIDTPTSNEALEVPMDDLDCLLVMTVKAGFSGQEFIPEMLGKVKDLRSKTNIPIEIDGGVTDITISEGLKAGVNRFVATNFIFKNENPQSQYQILNTYLQDH